MAYDAELANRLRHLVAANTTKKDQVSERKMFGGLAFLVGGNMSVAASGQGGLLVRVPPADTEDLLAEPGAEEFEMGGRGPMPGWVRVRGDALDDDATLEAWVRRGVGYTRSLPAK